MLTFGLTGGIASGKSAVAARFAERGLPVVDADVVAREVVEPGSDGLQEIALAFGDEVLSPDGALDRKKLAAAVFEDQRKLARLNAITHPRIAALSAKKLGDLAARGQPLACYEAALLVENGLADAFRPLVVVSAPLEAQVARAALRDAASAEHVRARIAAQRPLADKERLADVIVRNDGSLELLEARADDALDEVCRRAGIDPSRYPR